MRILKHIIINNSHICKKKFHNVDDNDDKGGFDFNDNDNSDDKKFDARRFYGDTVGFDDVDDNYYDHDDSNDGKFDARKFHGDATGLDDIDDNYDYYDDNEINGMRFHGFSKNYETVLDHYHYTSKYKVAAHNIYNLRYKTP